MVDIKQNHEQEKVSWVEYVVGSLAFALHAAEASLYGPEDWENRPETRLEKILYGILSRYQKDEVGRS